MDMKQVMRRKNTRMKMHSGQNTTGTPTPDY